MNQFEFCRKIPVEYRPEVLVLGAGPAGICAALAAARGGADTMLVERYGCAGGMATVGLVAPFMTSYDSGGGIRLIRGLFSEIVERMVSLGGAIDPSGVPAGSAFTSYIEKGHIHVTPFDAECLKLVADEMLTEAGVKLLYHSTFVAAEAEGGVVKRVVRLKHFNLIGTDKRAHKPKPPRKWSKKDIENPLTDWILRRNDIPLTL